MAHDLLFQDEALQATFFGNLTAVPDPPSRIVNIFVSSTKTDLEHERRQLHDVVVPQLQRACTGVDVQIVDVQNGCEEDSLAVDHHLREIEDCHRTSLGCFFLCLIGNKYRPFTLPASIAVAEYSHIHSAAKEAGLDASLLDNHYLLDSNLLPPRYVLQARRKSSTDVTTNTEQMNKIHQDSEEGNWPEEEDKLVQIIQYGARIAIQEGLIQPEEAMQSFLLSGVHTHLRHAVKLSKHNNSGVLCVVRQFEGINSSDNAAPLFTDSCLVDGASNEEDNTVGLQNLIEDVILNVDRKNVAYFSVPWSPSGLSPEIPEHSEYLKSFSEVITSKLKSLIEDAMSNWTPKWDLFPSAYRKSVQEVYRESQSHLLNSRRHLAELGVSQSLDSDCGALLQIQRLMLGGDDKLRHSPLIVCGRDGSGKSTLLAQVITYCTEWLGGDVIRIVRHVGQSPCSAYTSELLRNLCLHISLVFDFDPTHHSFELGELSIWFQDLLKMVESTPTDLVIVLDDLHELRSPGQSAILGWLPWNLPPNVHIVCSISEDAEEVLRLLRTRWSAFSDTFVQLQPLGPAAALSQLQSKLRDRKRTLSAAQLEAVKGRLQSGTEDGWGSLYVDLLSKVAEGWRSWTEVTSIPATVEAVVDCLLSGLKERYGFRTMRKVATFLACTTFGLRENELIELLAMSVDPGDDKQQLATRPANWFATVREMKPLLKEYYVDRRPYLHWSHNAISKHILNKYLKTERDIQACYTELANAFHLGFLMEKEKDENGEKDPSKRKDDWCDVLREIDEMWFCLLRSGDRKKLKEEAICNFDFLQCAVAGASVSYVRSILELVKCQILDWELELLSAVTKQAVDVLSQDPSQLATELLNWLKPYADGSDSPYLKGLVSNALQFCDRAAPSRLLPTNSWLRLALPPQVASMAAPRDITHLVASPDSQHVLLCSTDGKDVDMFHLPSKNFVRSFQGHKAAITCLHVTCSGAWLISGSEDTDVIVWHTDTGQIKHRLSNHISGVLCVATTRSESHVLSGSEIGVVIVARLDTGEVVHKLDKHRGLISSIVVTYEDDMFATGSSDKMVHLWKLDNFQLCQSFSLTSGICRMALSHDNTFLVAACEDMCLHVRALSTGYECHVLQGGVTAVAFGGDTCRCVVGCADGKCHVYDIHSATLITTLAGHSEAVTSIQVQPNDTFLITGGGNKVVMWNFSIPKREINNNNRKEKVKRVDSHKEPIVCLAVSKDGALAVTGSKDNTLKVWNLTTGDVSQNLSGHTAPVTCAAVAPNGLFVVSGSEDSTLKVFGLTMGLAESTFKEHQSKIVSVNIASDSRRVLSADSQGNHRLWAADNGSQLYVCAKPTVLVTLHNSMVFSVAGKNENTLKFWPLMDVDVERSVSHSDSILCYTVTHDCETVITGSNDMSLKVWEVATGKLTQVLAGHEGSVTCVAVAPLSPSLVVSGSSDCTLILWDMLTGSDNLSFRGHTDTVKCATLAPDASTLLSGSSDNTIQLWNTHTGDRISMLDLHAQLVSVSCSFNLSHVVVQLAKSSSVPILRHHNNPAKGITLDMLPGHEEDPKSLGSPGALPKRIGLRGNLKREQSFDSLYWELKSSSPRHEFLPNLDELKRQPLSSAGSVWDGTKVRLAGGILRPSDTLQSKPKMAKHKLLKKQQSMFAFFPDHNQQQQTKDQEARKADILAKIQSANRELKKQSFESAENPAEKNGDGQETKGADVTDSTVCAIA